MNFKDVNEPSSSCSRSFLTWRAPDLTQTFCQMSAQGEPVASHSVFGGMFSVSTAGVIGMYRRAQRSGGHGLGKEAGVLRW